MKSGSLARSTLWIREATNEAVYIATLAVDSVLTVFSSEELLAVKLPGQAAFGSYNRILEKRSLLHFKLLEASAN